MRTLVMCGLAVALTAATASAAPNVVNNSQKGSLLVFTDIYVDATDTTIIRLVNDGDSDVKVKCVYSDAGAQRNDDPTDPPIKIKNWTDFVLTLTPRQPVWFDARTGYGSSGPGTANSFPPQYGRGELICFAITNNERNKRKYNHLTGTATYLSFAGDGVASEYTAHAFYARTISNDPVTMALDGVEYDYCPAYLIGQFMPSGIGVRLPGSGAFGMPITFLTVSSCTQFPIQDGRPVFTKLEFEVWNAHEVKFTGAYRCSDSWWDTMLDADPKMYNPQNFTYAQLGTTSAYYRVKGVASIRCAGSVNVGLIATQATFLGLVPPGRLGSIPSETVETLPSPTYDFVETNLTHAGTKAGSISWDLGSATEEGRIR